MNAWDYMYYSFRYALMWYKAAAFTIQGIFPRGIRLLLQCDVFSIEVQTGSQAALIFCTDSGMAIRLFETCASNLAYLSKC